MIIRSSKESHSQYFFWYGTGISFPFIISQTLAPMKSTLTGRARTSVLQGPVESSRIPSTKSGPPSTCDTLLRKEKDDWIIITPKNLIGPLWHLPKQFATHSDSKAQSSKPPVCMLTCPQKQQVNFGHDHRHHIHIHDEKPLSHSVCGYVDMWMC
jgi:hypothetical protein